MFFSASAGGAGRELWKSDGTATGTVLVKDINPNNSNPNGGNSYVADITNVNGVAFFSAENGTASRVTEFAKARSCLRCPTKRWNVLPLNALVK